MSTYERCEDRARSARKPRFGLLSVGFPYRRQFKRRLIRFAGLPIIALLIASAAVLSTAAKAVNETEILAGDSVMRLTVCNTGPGAAEAIVTAYNEEGDVLERRTIDLATNGCETLEAERLAKSAHRYSVSSNSPVDVRAESGEFETIPSLNKGASALVFQMFYEGDADARDILLLNKSRKKVAAVAIAADVEGGELARLPLKELKKNQSTRFNVAESFGTDVAPHIAKITVLADGELCGMQALKGNDAAFLTALIDAVTVWTLPVAFNIGDHTLNSSVFITGESEADLRIEYLDSANILLGELPEAKLKANGTYIIGAKNIAGLKELGAVSMRIVATAPVIVSNTIQVDDNSGITAFFGRPVGDDGELELASFDKGARLIVTNANDQAISETSGWAITRFPQHSSLITPQAVGDRAQFEGDVTYSDHSVVSAGANFRKTWRFRNIGSRAWSNYQFRHASGDRMSTTTAVTIPYTSPNATVDISVDMRAPNAPICAAKSGSWRIVDSNGAAVTGGAATIAVTVNPPMGPNLNNRWHLPSTLGGANGFASRGYGGQCTAYAYGRAYEVNGNGASGLPSSGDAKTWYNATTLPKGTTIRANSIGVCGGDSTNTHGHVFYVESVSSDRLNAVISEANFRCFKNDNWGGGYDGEVKPVRVADLGNRSGCGPITGYIYLGSAQTQGDFSLAAPIFTQTVNVGSTAAFTINTATTSGLPQTVSLTATGAPSGSSVVFYPQTITSGNASTMAVYTSGSTPTGTYTIRITGTGSTGVARTALVSLTVQANGYPPTARFAMSANGQTVIQGQTLSFTVGYNGNVGVTLDARSSSSGSSPIQSYTFTSNGGYLGSGSYFSYTFGPGTHNLRLEVRDVSGRSAFAYATLIIRQVAIYRIDPVSPYAASYDQNISVYGEGLERTNYIQVIFPGGGSGYLNRPGQIFNITASSLTMRITLGGRGNYQIRLYNLDGRVSNTFSFNVR